MITVKELQRRDSAPAGKRCQPLCHNIRDNHIDVTTTCCVQAAAAPTLPVVTWGYQEGRPVETLGKTQALEARRLAGSRFCSSSPSSRSKSVISWKSLYTLANRMYATWSSFLSSASTSSPTSWLVTLGPLRRSLDSTFAAAAATCSGVTGRFVRDLPMPATILSRR